MSPPDWCGRELGAKLEDGRRSSSELFHSRVARKLKPSFCAPHEVCAIALAHLAATEMTSCPPWSGARCRGPASPSAGRVRASPARPPFSAPPMSRRGADAAFSPSLISATGNLQDVHFAQLPAVQLCVLSGVQARQLGGPCQPPCEGCHHLASSWLPHDGHCR